MCLIIAISYANKRLKCFKMTYVLGKLLFPCEFKSDVSRRSPDSLSRRVPTPHPLRSGGAESLCCVRITNWKGNMVQRVGVEWETERTITGSCSICPEIHSAAVLSILCLLLSVGAEKTSAFYIPRLWSTRPPVCLCTLLCLDPRRLYCFSWSHPGMQWEPVLVRLLLWRWGWNVLYFNAPSPHYV